MSTIRQELINAAINKTYSLTDYYNIHNNSHKQYEFYQQTLLSDESLIKDENVKAIRRINEASHRDKVMKNSGTRRICENCNKECLATSYCEYCVQII
ncbi:hypothetical protein RclHR1_00020020 [Rhizophagus clarus]|uniref:Kinase-like domain-containing protein n=1 Tax=Rhizophagus clarus TaxID=94130 RepID=A0A2Z6QQF9_9GLOM|nr:hypothetical protein RclHR1_00020020 [Rhizophagus clarus]GES80146.1 kinase-like domain-containing protein [Rhizophagus clarus]